MDIQKARLDTLIKEAELLRAESLLCIGNVRRMTGFVTSIAGAGIPLLAAILNIGNSKTTIFDLESLTNIILQNAALIQIITLCIAFTCVAFFRIYLGIFLQIFMIAKYMRDIISTKITKILNDSDSSEILPYLDFFYWEKWLKNSRNENKHNVGDVDLAIEPMLMATYSISYAGISCYVAYLKNNTCIVYFLSGFVLLACLISLKKYYDILKGAVH